MQRNHFNFVCVPCGCRCVDMQHCQTAICKALSVTSGFVWPGQSLCCRLSFPYMVQVTFDLTWVAVLHITEIVYLKHIIPKE